MTYQRALTGRQKVRYDNANADLPLVHQFSVDDAAAVPTSATISIYEPGNSTALVDGAAMETSTDRGDSDDTLLTYAVDTTTEADWPIKEGYRAEIVVVFNSTNYPRHLLFDVARYVFLPNLTFDRLVAMDDNVRDMQHDGDGDFSELIGSCRENLQLKIESRVVNNKRLLQEMLLDSSKFVPVLRAYVLSYVYLNRKDMEMMRHYKGEYEDLFNAVMSSVSLDEGQDGEEDQHIGIVDDTRIEL